ncbi:hypothetical protein Q3G72_001439 [Acer saccharum]|nr:hypothetical protein Q3G72_001439 [Acer saccharum]
MFDKQNVPTTVVKACAFAWLAVAASACGKSSSASVTDTNPPLLQTTTQVQSPNTNSPQPYTETPSNPPVAGTSAGNTNGSSDATSTGLPVGPPFVSGDPNRFKYVFFAKQDVGYGTDGAAPIFGLVFTTDSNFCSRTAVPMFQGDFVVYQIPFVQNNTMASQPLYYATTAPDVHSHLFGVDASLLNGYNDVGYTSECDLYLGLGAAYDTPSWSIWTADGAVIDTSDTVNYRFSVRNETQAISLVGTAQRCQAALPFFGNHADNPSTHTKAALVRSLGAKRGSTLGDRFAVHFTPKHGSWLDEAEIEISMFSRQCLGDDRIVTRKTLAIRAAAWCASMNIRKVKIGWSFTQEKAIKKKQEVNFVRTPHNSVTRSTRAYAFWQTQGFSIRRIYAASLANSIRIGESPTHCRARSFASSTRFGRAAIGSRHALYSWTAPVAQFPIESFGSLRQPQAFIALRARRKTAAKLTAPNSGGIVMQHLHSIKICPKATRAYDADASLNLCTQV